jgi:tetratricopeptide (TPR) repeat protein
MADTDSAQDNELPWDKETLEKFVKGEITLGEMAGVDADSQTKIVQMGHRLLSSGKLDDAKLIFEGLVALNPYEPYYLLAAGGVAQQQERWEDAEQWYSRCLAYDDKNVVAYANRGEVRVMLENIDGAAEDLVNAVKNDPEAKEPTTQRAKGLLVEIKRQLDKAQAEDKK